MRAWLVLLFFAPLLALPADAGCHPPPEYRCTRLDAAVMEAEAPTKVEMDEIRIYAMAHRGDGTAPAEGVPKVAPGGMLVLQVDVHGRGGDPLGYRIQGLSGMTAGEKLIADWHEPLDGAVDGLEQTLLWFVVADFDAQVTSLEAGALPVIRTVGFELNIQGEAGDRIVHAQVPIELIVSEAADPYFGVVDDTGFSAAAVAGLMLAAGVVSFSMGFAVAYKGPRIRRG